MAKNVNQGTADSNPAPWNSPAGAGGTGFFRSPSPQFPSGNSLQGPQCFAPARPGSETIDPQLVAQNQKVEQEMFEAAESYFKDKDFRWFFSYAHATITHLINLNLVLFQRPNALLRFNLDFGRAYLKALRGASSGLSGKRWRIAFAACKGLQYESDLNDLIPLAIKGDNVNLEACGALMAEVHIHVDLAAAMSEVGCIPPEDYGNMLYFVDAGSRKALIAYRGKFGGRLEDWVQHHAFPPLVRMWRDAVYQTSCNVNDVPPPGKWFVDHARGVSR